MLASPDRVAKLGVLPTKGKLKQESAVVIERWASDSRQAMFGMSEAIGLYCAQESNRVRVATDVCLDYPYSCTVSLLSDSKRTQYEVPEMKSV
jgi:hypothetical protein